MDVSILEECTQAGQARAGAEPRLLAEPGSSTVRWESERSPIREGQELSLLTRGGPGRDLNKGPTPWGLELAPARGADAACNVHTRLSLFVCGEQLKSPSPPQNRADFSNRFLFCP